MSKVFYYTEDGQKHPIADNDEAKQLVDEGKVHADSWIEIDGRIFSAKKIKAWKPYFTESGYISASESGNQILSPKERDAFFDRIVDDFEQPVSPPQIVFPNENLRNRRTQTKDFSGTASYFKSSSQDSTFKTIQKKYDLPNIEDSALFETAKKNLPPQVKKHIAFVQKVNKFLGVAGIVFFAVFFFLSFLILVISGARFEDFVSAAFFGGFIFVPLVVLKWQLALQLTYFDMALLQSRDNLRQVICLNAILNSSARSETEAMHEERDSWLNDEI